MEQAQCESRVGFLKSGYINKFVTKVIQKAVI